MASIGRHIADLRSRGGLSKNPQRATARAAQLTEIDPDRDCPCPLNRQRHYRVLADLVDDDGRLPDIAPGLLMDGDSIERWLRQRKQPGIWERLLPEQQERPTRLGTACKRRLPPPATKGAGRPERGIAGVPAAPGGPRPAGGARRVGPYHAATAKRSRSTAGPSRWSSRWAHGHRSQQTTTTPASNHSARQQAPSGRYLRIDT